LNNHLSLSVASSNTIIIMNRRLALHTSKKSTSHVSTATALGRSMRVGTGVIGTSGVRITGIATTGITGGDNSQAQASYNAAKPMPPVVAARFGVRNQSWDAELGDHLNPGAHS
jgi:hypothetical protein